MKMKNRNGLALWTIGAGGALAVALSGCGSGWGQASKGQSARPAPGTARQLTFDPFDPTATRAFNSSGAFASGSGTEVFPHALYANMMSGAMHAAASANGSFVDGAALAQVSFASEGADFDPDVSRDGKSVVFASTQHRPNPDIYAKRIGSRVVTQLTSDPASDVMPKISPDGSRIAFASNRTGNWDIFVMPINGGQAIQVTTDGADELHPTWSPDGRQIAFCRFGQSSGQWEIWVTDVEKTGVSRFLGHGMFPQWCPVAATGANGADKILFQKSRERGDRAFGVWTIDYRGGETSNPTEIASTPLAACVNPSWSPDGRWVAFATLASGGGGEGLAGRPTQSDLWMIDLEGSARLNLTAHAGLNLMPSWGPDFKLYFVCDRSGSDNIWSMETSGAIRLATGMSEGPTGHASASGGAARPAPGTARTTVTGVTTEGQ